ncbi:MAG: flagellar basal body L-ring protein FlgH [Balneolaceae bacterium]
MNDGSQQIAAYGWITGFLLAGLIVPSDVQAQQSLYQDVKANEVGDVITVILSENISGSTTSDSRRSTQSEGATSGSVSGNFLPFEPTFGADASVDYGADERNLSNQRQLLEGSLSVQVVEVNPRGDLTVEGSRMTEINGEKHTMELSGVVRPNDVNDQNEVLSWRVANATIRYHKQEDLDQVKQRKGVIRKVVFTGVGLLLGGAILSRELQ